jgi:hypothetical protein
MHYEKYKDGRNWAVYDSNDNLIAVVVYRKGAKEIVRRLNGTTNAVIPDDIIKLAKEIKLASQQLLNTANDICK